MPFDPRRRTPLVFTPPVRLDPDGVTGPTRHQARRGKWRRVGSGLYVPSEVDPTTPEQRAVELAARYPESAISGWGALWMHGAGFFDGCAPDGRTPLPLAVALGRRRGCRATDAVRLSYEELEPDDAVTVWGVAVTTPARALFDEVRAAASWREAVVAIEMAVAAGVIGLGDLRRYAELHRSWRRSGRVLGPLAHCVVGAESPNETRLRLLWTVDAGLPPPLVNATITDRAGHTICRADLLDPEAGLVAEYDGAEHRAASRHTSDVRREERCRELGLEYVKVTGLDLLEPWRVVTRLRSVRSRARFDPPDRRAWRLRAT